MAMGSLGFGNVGGKDAGQQWNCQNGYERFMDHHHLSFPDRTGD
jgi:hypothetical protein